MAKGDIQSRLKLDTKQFLDQLDAAFKRVQAVGKAVQGVPFAPKTGSGGDSAKTLAAAHEAARRATGSLRDYERQLRGNEITTEQFQSSVNALIAVLYRERSALEGDTEAYAAYDRAIRKADLALNGSMNTRPVVNRLDTLNDALGRFQAAGALLLSGSFFQRFFQGLDNLVHRPPVR